MPNQGTESQFEETTIDRLLALPDYRYQYGGDIERDWREVVMTSWLWAFLEKKYPHLPGDALKEIITKVSHPEGITTEQRNKNFHAMLTRGFEQKYRKPDGTETFEHIYVVEWDADKWADNDFCVVNQLTIRGANDRRPDIIIYLNGFPIVLFELKNPYEEEPNTLGAFNQVQHYKAGISQLFDYNALVVVSDGGMVGQADDDTPHAVGSTLHGMWTSTWEWFAPWKSINGRDVVESSTGAMKSLIEGLFPPERLLDYIRHFIAFEVETEKDSQKIEKKGAKYHQYFGVRFAVEEAIRATRPDGDRKIGVIWHTQGSGKSLSMAYFVAILRHDPRMENPTFVIQVDSTDIDDQLHDQFVAVKALVGDVQHAESIEELRSLLSGEGGEVIFSTIQKFQLGDDEVVHPTLSTRRNVIVIADEAHRSQYGLKEGFAHQLRKALPNASFIGFTGTPISFASADTQAVFGNVIHSYDMLQSKKDHSTVPIYYEPRLIKLELTNDQIDSELAEITEEAGSDAGQLERARWAAIAEAAGTKERVADLAKTLLDHFQKRNKMLNGKAMVVCMSRRNCVKLYDALKELPGCPEVKIVMTGNLAEDPPAWSRDGHITTKPQRDAIKARMKDIDDPLKIAIVRDMWLTGTDIPCLHTLYVDKPMKGHTLMQAIARVNRIFSNKPGGLVVDFIGIGDQLKEATKKYTQGGGAGNPAPDISKEAKEVFLQTLVDVRDLLPELPKGKSYGDWRALPNIEFEDLFLQCCGQLTETDELRDDFLAAEARLNSAFSLVNHLPDCIGVGDEVVFYQLLRKQLNKTTTGGASTKDEQKAKAVRELLDRSIESKGVVDIFAAAGIEKADISILDEKFLEEFKSHEQENLRLKLLAKILADEIRVREKMNLAKYRSFKEMLEQTLLKYHNRAIQAADVVRVMIEIRKDIDNEAARSKALNLSPEEIAFYDAVAANIATLFDEKTLCDLVRDVVQAVKKNLKVDWTKPHREDVKAGVRAAVKNVLRRRGVKKEMLDALTDKVIVQAEALFKEWPLAA